MYDCIYLDHFTKRRLFKATIILVPVMGFTWIIGLFAVGEEGVVFAYLFVIANVLQVRNMQVHIFMTIKYNIVQYYPISYCTYTMYLCTYVRIYIHIPALWRCCLACSTQEQVFSLLNLWLPLLPTRLCSELPRCVCVHFMYYPISYCTYISQGSKVIWNVSFQIFLTH